MNNEESTSYKTLRDRIIAETKESMRLNLIKRKFEIDDYKQVADLLISWLSKQPINKITEIVKYYDSNDIGFDFGPMFKVKIRADFGDRTAKMVYHYLKANKFRNKTKKYEILHELIHSIYDISTIYSKRTILNILTNTVDIYYIIDIPKEAYKQNTFN